MFVGIDGRGGGGIPPTASPHETLADIGPELHNQVLMAADPPSQVAKDLFEVAAAAEQSATSAEIDAAAERVSLGAVALAAGIVTVALDEQGRLCEFQSDGSTTAHVTRLDLIDEAHAAR